MRQLLFRGSTLLPWNHSRFSWSSSCSSSSLPKMNSSAGEKVSSNIPALTSDSGTCSISSCDLETQHAINQPQRKKPLVSHIPILKHLGLLKPQKRSNSTCTTKPQHDPPAGLEASKTMSQPKLLSTTLNSINNDKDKASPPSIIHSSLISEDRVNPSSELTEVNNNKSATKLHYERDVESTGLLEGDLNFWKTSTSNQNEACLAMRPRKRKKSPEFRRKPASADSVQVKGSKWRSDCSPGIRNHFTPVETFDICAEYTNRRSIEEEDVSFIMETIPMHEPTSDEGCHQLVLRPGMVLLKRFLTLDEQVSIVRKCRALGLGPGGFYRPGYKDGAKLRLQMMCLGLDWDPQTRKYSKTRRIDKCQPPSIPHEFGCLVDRAMRCSQDLVVRKYDMDNVDDVLPTMSSDICIVNFYTTSGRLGLHQDRDETPESIAKGLPVVSFSIGDSAEFLYGEKRRIDKAEKVILESGDVLVFGGDSRLIFHGVQSIIPGSAPSPLVEETGFRPGRLNLTFRQY